ncbi:NAD-dependent succinate-semialdehyde dehydrogenase [Ornithobacterium rhinotracheale]|uniref:NAD-dependent aldehyde dehydrogenase n=1 Tax=Ornithobacterium rhinotracheale (strain ATCC 51463 / DSM 15997 / CCUG 23171 / CIP 104009 / LMG 9086) TaxID=867902 RepID=I4A2V8_ORNRL|nr:NAD-dependent succinate-semialdehyde dehydrogenase [Ornithobacterium rhinotracheale]AFL98292.1 NAD-dependent aldehyde dehydrogenase [Ornithobacterium rhinotracheale DSM 15997]AIQ00066.1 succinate-semialdehyde dehdyrogenase [Ornithobacterium rhinotracheale ORT-UMN 88]KGB66164.1 succinate-semialdehyde dehdyrogenase [Ornithobacterium rhinotracheale H06-030791]MBN3662766.1 NAD-dependent succinate-semialdehyde dehydrogenase [Ornithobacterium rhinotracheale]MCK0193362.1 NAD-dependent succinate-se
MKSINPFTQETIYEHAELSEAEIIEKIESANVAQPAWNNISLKKRKKIFKKLAEVLEENAYEWGRTISEEMGKPITQSIAEINKCAWVCRYYASNAQKLLKSKHTKTEAQKSYVRYDPLGVILGVMPWNFPFWQVIRFAVPTLMAGNTVLLKHASNVMQSAKNVEKAFELAGLPENCFINLPISSKAVEGIIRHPMVKGVSLTGSKAAGAAVAKVAGEEIKPSLLELGGSNALVVFEDCDIKEAVKTVVNARFQNTGQSCIAGKRLLVHEKIAEKFVAKLQKKVEELVVGNPLEDKTYLSVMARESLAEELEKQMNDSVEMGAKILIGGTRHEAFFAPTILTHVTPEMPVFYEETFGPLLACTTFKTDDEALELVNNSEFGLGASIFTEDKKRIKHFIKNIKDGAVFINEMVKSDPRLAFGGTGISGYGRELAENGIKAFVNEKTVYIA